MDVKLNQTLSPNSATDREDVRTLKSALNWLGYYTPYSKTGITEYADQSLFEAITEFQSDHNLSISPHVKPNDQTVEVLSREIQKLTRGDSKNG